MMFEADDLDWAMGELAHLFSHANRVGILPHELNPDLFHGAWSVLNCQPFVVAEYCRSILLSMLTAPLWQISQSGGITRNFYRTKFSNPKRYENPLLN
jgi:hypothetical protein